MADYCDNCDYSPVSFSSTNRCPIRDKAIREKKKIPLGRKCKFYYNLSEVADKVIDELVEKKLINTDIKD